MGTIVTGLRDAFRYRAFVLCVVVLASSAAGLEWAVNALGVRFRKRPIPLRQPLDHLETLLEEQTPYRVLKKVSLSEESIAALGTDKFVYWVLDDTSRPPGDPLRRLVLFVTYYTGNPDQVPHVPDWCMTASGYEVQQTIDDLVEIRSDAGEATKVPLRTLRFAKSELGYIERPTVLYTFRANGEFYGGRTGVRVALGDPRTEYAYFSKVEVAFWPPSKLRLGPNRSRQGPTFEAAIRAGKTLFQTVLPVLLERFWPE